MEVTRHSIDEVTPDEWDEIARYKSKDYNKQYTLDDFKIRSNCIFLYLIALMNGTHT